MRVHCFAPTRRLHNGRIVDYDVIEARAYSDHPGDKEVYRRICVWLSIIVVGSFSHEGLGPEQELRVSGASRLQGFRERCTVRYISSNSQLSRDHRYIESVFELSTVGPRYGVPLRAGMMSQLRCILRDADGVYDGMVNCFPSGAQRISDCCTLVCSPTQGCVLGNTASIRPT